MSLQSEVNDGLRVAGWDQSIAAVKRVMANALVRLDPAVTITDTQYFNHSFVPDFILSWPREADRKRDVFLRLDSSRSFLSSDLGYLRDGAPLLLGLEEIGQDVVAENAAGGLADDAKESSTLIADPAAIEVLGDPTSGFDLAQVVPSSLLKGGRGVLIEPTAAALTTSADAFFSGARSHDGQAVSDAGPDVTAFLDDRQSARVVNLGRLIWEATGGEPTEFPIQTGLSGIDDAGLRFLLEESPIDDPSFWRAIGQAVSLPRLVGFGAVDGFNVGAFIRANADRLLARVLMVKGAQPNLDDSGPRWRIAPGTLVLDGHDFDAYVAPTREGLQVPADHVLGLTLEDFRDRVGTEQVAGVTVVASDGKRVKIESDDSFDPLSDQVMESVAHLSGARVQSFGIMAAGKHLECELTTRTASGHTNALFDVASLLDRGLPLLWPLEDERDATEVAAVRAQSSAAQPQTLFDAAEEDL